MSEQLILAISILAIASFFVVSLSYRTFRQDYLEFSKSNSFLALLVVALVAILTSLYAFSEKEWVSDLLKVIIGMVGGGAAAAAATTINQSIQGNNNFQAVNAQIEKLNSQISNIERANAEKLEQVLNVATHGFADFRQPENSIIPLGRVRFRYEIGKELDHSPHLSARAVELRERAQNPQHDSIQSGKIFDFEPYPLIFLDEPDCRQKLLRFLKYLNDRGFVVVSSEGWDNVHDGIEFYFRVGKRLDETTDI